MPLPRDDLLALLARAQLPRTPPYPCPYLPGRTSRQYGFAAPRLDPEVYHDLMDRGFRRSGEVFYAMDCIACRACVPLRVPVATFAPSRSQRRVLRKNRDVAVQFGPPHPTPEVARIYGEYLRARHPDSPQLAGAAEGGDADVESLYESAVDTVEARYSIGDRLVAFSLVDVSSRSVSAVYHCFAPEHESRSLGVFSVLAEIEYARSLAVPYYYLGYWVAGSRTMNYKADFGPHEVLRDGTWQPAGDANGASCANPAPGARPGTA